SGVRRDPPSAPASPPPAGLRLLEPAGPRPLGPVHLSPRMTAIFGGLFGLAVLASLIAMLIQVVPPRDERALLRATASAVHPPPPPEIKKKKRPPVPGPWRLSELEKDPGVAVERGTIERQPFVDALAEKKVPKAQAYRVMKAFESIRKFDKCGKKDHFAVAMDKGTHRVRALEYEISPSEIYQAREDASGLLVGQRLDMKIADEETVGAFYVTSDVGASYAMGGFEDGVLTTINEALSGRMSTESFEEGSTVRLI